MRILFMGSAAIACPSLRNLLATPRHEVVGVVTQPDRPKGRHQLMAACPVKEFVQNRGVPVFTPEKVGDPSVVEQLALLKPDVIALVAFGQYLKPAVLALPSRGAINVHPSLLPKYRGAAPIQWAVARGETVTGVTIMHIGEKMDAGDIILQETMPIAPEDTADSLTPRLAERGAELLLQAVDLLAEGRAPRRPQDEAGVTMAPRLTKEQGRLDWRMKAIDLHNHVRGFQPWPGCHFEYPVGSGQVVKVHRTCLEEGAGQPGTILEIGGAGPLIATGEGALRLLDVQPPGKKAMPAAAWLRGYRLQVGDGLG